MSINENHNTDSNKLKLLPLVIDKKSFSFTKPPLSSIDTRNSAKTTKGAKPPGFPV